MTSTYELDGYYSVEHLPDDCMKTQYGNIAINDDAYIGANCTIMPGVIIGEGAVVGANSLVNKDLEPWTIYAGSPCKKLRKREKPTGDRKILINSLDWSSHL